MLDALTYGWCIIAVMLFISFAFVVAQVKHRLDVVDVAWGGNFIVAAVVSFLLQPEADSLTIGVRTLVTALVIIWGMRLSHHILQRLRRTSEDHRYVAMRKQWKGNLAINAYFKIFFTQGLLALVIVTPVLLINLTSGSFMHPLGWAGVLTGLAVWLIGFYFESTGDRQLRDFIADPKNKGKLMTKGLWRYSRHPNYFGEVTQWWGLAVMGVGLSFGFVGFVGALAITYLIVFVSGVPLLEKKYADRADWKAYKQRTSMLIPLPRRK